MNADEYVDFSPSTHTVPCSPFLRTYEASPAPCVPDVDRNATRRLRYTTTQGDSQKRILNYINNWTDMESYANLKTDKTSTSDGSHSQGGTISPMRFSQQCSQSSQNDAQQIPATPCIEKQKVSQKKISLEQVVPSCSPFISFEDEKPANSQQTDQASQESTTNDFLDILLTNNNNIQQKENHILLDEKPPRLSNTELQDFDGPKPAKRQSRMMQKNTDIKPIDFLKSDNIFG